MIELTDLPPHFADWNQARHAFDGLDITDLLFAAKENFGKSPFLIWEPLDGRTQTWTYDEFVQDVTRFASTLRARGIRQREAVLIHLENCPEFLISYYGCAVAGCVAVTTNTRSSLDELRYCASHSGVVAAVTQPRYLDLVSRAAHELRALAVTVTDTGQAPQIAQLGSKVSDFADWLAAEPAGRMVERDPFAPVAVQYTSGTTSRPKGVLWTHANVLWSARVNATHQGLRADDRYHVHLPLFHANASAYSVQGTLWAGGTIVLVPRFSASRFWSVSLKHRCTWTSTIWFCVRALNDRELPDEHQYRLWGYPTIDPAVEARYGVKLIGWWGMTETISHGILSDPRVPCSPGAIGRPATEYDIAVINSGGRPAESGEIGDLLVRGRPGVSLFQGYLNDAAATAAAYTGDGWFKTGDAVRLRDDGSIEFADRQRDLLKIGGENVSASEIERVILGVSGVQEAAVVGRSHPMLDEVPVAFVTARKTTENLTEQILTNCRENLADFKVPVEIRIISDFPRATLGKIAKSELRKLLDEAPLLELERVPPRLD